MRQINRQLKRQIKQTAESEGRRKRVPCWGVAGALLLAAAQAFAGPAKSDLPGNASPAGPPVAAVAREAENQGPASALLPSGALRTAGKVMAPGAPGRLDNQASERRIVVSLADRKLVLLEGGRVVKVYPVAVGAPGTPSPTGRLRVVSKLAAPTWYHPGKVVGPGKQNPLGTRWVGLSRKGYGIHGTNVPSSIGHAASHGCIRMRTRDAEELFERVRVGDPVEITSGEVFQAVSSSARQPKTLKTEKLSN